VTDLELPGNSGFAFIATLRADIQYRSIPIIGLTLRPDPQLIALARRFKITEVVSKVDRRGLLSALAELSGSLEEAA
jgi:two-component system chemotaxis sensor kinase CheA